MLARPGHSYQQVTNYNTALQIDPVVPCDVLFNITAPDGSKRITQASGTVALLTSKEKWPLDQTGVWSYNVNATWNGFKVRVQGLVDQGG